MKLVFSEAKPNYGQYVFPYAVWAFPEKGETPAALLGRGFLPSSRNLDRFYLCRHVRVDLRKFRPSSENRRILRKGDGISCRMIPRSEFDYSAERRDFFKTYADIRFGKEVMPFARLDSLFQSPITSHLLLFMDKKSGAEVGTVTLYVEPPAAVYYYYAFYDLRYYERNLGMFMMTSAVEFFAAKKFEFLYLGSCYQPNALYKTQFSGSQFFNGVRWSDDLKELKFLIQRDEQPTKGHLLESDDYLGKFYAGDLDKVVPASQFHVATLRSR
jgi:arginyl-tRNA--protein-N-Asp/Glu arginylyltransferase